MNRRFRLSQAATADLDDIWVYVAQEGSDGAANLDVAKERPDESGRGRLRVCAT